MNPHWNAHLNKTLSRRDLLQVSSAGFGSLALAGLLGAEQPKGPLDIRSPHFPAKAKRVIFLFMHGGPSQVDTFDTTLGRAKGKGLPWSRLSSGL